MWQADMVTRHIFFGQKNNFSTWVDTFVDRFPDLTEDLREYEKAYNDPDPVQAQRYYVEDHFYEDTDDIIQYVRAYQNGETPESDIETVVELAKDQSLYSQTLRQGYFYIKGASVYFVGNITKNEFQKIIDKRIS